MITFWFMFLYLVELVLAKHGTPLKSSYNVMLSKNIVVEEGAGSWLV